MEVDLERSRWTADYLLGHCEAFRVESVEGTVGCVEEVVLAADGSEPLALRVRTGGAADAALEPEGRPDRDDRVAEAEVVGGAERERAERGGAAMVGAIYWFVYLRGPAGARRGP